MLRRLDFPFIWYHLVFCFVSSWYMLLIMRKSRFGAQEGREVAKKKPFVPPPRFMNVDEARYN